jgi:uncharacterized protein (DUF433 family)
VQEVIETLARTSTASRVDRRFDVPLYTVAEAARALRMSESTLATWVKGYTRKRAGAGSTTGAPIIESLPPTMPKGPTIPFVGLAEGMVLGAVREAKVPLQRVRPALEVLAQELGVQHALASDRLYTDGAEILYDYAEKADLGGRGVRDLVVVRSKQRVLAPVVEAYLRRISYGADGYARLIRLPGYPHAEVLADPERSFGQPIFARGGARVVDVLDRFWAGESLDDLSKDYGVPIAELEDALRAASRRAA